MVELLDINNAGQFRSVGAAQGRVASTVAQIGPLAPSWHVEQAPGPVAYSPPHQAKPGALSAFSNFVGHVGSSIGHVGEAAGAWLAHNAASLITAPIRLGANLGHLGLAAWSLNEDAKQADVQAGRLDNLIAQFKSGEISADQYKKGLFDWNQDNANLQSDLQANRQRLTLAGKASVGAGIDVGALVASVLTGGVAGFAAKDVGVSTAAQFLAADTADAGLYRAAAGLSKLSLDKSFAKLSPGLQASLNRAIAETVADTPAHLTAAQLARATVANLAFKYPVYYNVLSGGGHDVYVKLDDKQYGPAVQAAAFNALLLLSGGVFGQALKYGGKAVKGLSGAAFGQTTFLDELSRGIGDGNPSGLYRAVLAIKDPKAQAEAVKLLKAAEATNLAAVGGSEPVAAAWRVLNGMKDAYGIDLRQSTHAEELDNMLNHFKAQRLANAIAKRLGLENVTVGRFDPKVKANIATHLQEGATPQERLKIWETMKAAYPNQAFANNRNLDKQIKRLIAENDSNPALSEAIIRIEARFAIKGATKAELNSLAKMGYLPIQPKNLAAPFREGEGQLASAFAKPGDLFVRASQPLPVLRHIGQLLTGMGLSPNAATARTYQLFNMNLAEQMKDLTVTRRLSEGLSEASNGASADEQAVDLIVKKLSDYAKAPTGGKVLVRPAFTDLRQLGVKDIAKALAVSRQEASEVQLAISRAMLKVPLDVRGLGDRLVDVSYPVLRKYLRIQAVGRFTYNPFFQYLRLIPKTEILTAGTGGGVLKSIFAGRWSELGDIRQALRRAGAFEEAGRLGTVTSGEAVDYAGATGRNLTKRLLPMQERSIAGLIDAQASKMGMDYREYIASFPEQVNDTVQTIAQYDKHANFLNSPLVKTLNVAVFPFRFEAKVAGIMAKALGQAHPLTQVAVLKGLIGAHQWLTSPEGQAWYSANSEAIGLFKYITPVATLNEVMQSLLPGHDHHLGNFGELGGLPFGFIPLLTDSLGLTDFKQPGVNPKTGAIYSDYIPVSERGRVAVTIQDFLGTLFGYPGATAGLPSKTKLTAGASNFLTGAKPADYNITTPAISAQQTEYSNIVQGLNNPPSPASSPLPSPGIPVPPEPSSALNPRPRGRAGSATTRKKQFKPALLPGQSTYGQL